VDLFAPFTCTTEPRTKLEPLTVRVKPLPPETTLAGDSVESPGTGLLTVKATDELVPPPGVVTVIDKVPAVARSAVVRVVANCEPLMKVVAWAAPLTWMTELLMKLLPVTVRVIGPLPAVAEEGEILLTVGVAAATVKLIVFDVQLPSDELTTVRA